MKIVLALRQPKSRLRLLTLFKFTSNTLSINRNDNGLFKCNNIRCNICSSYIQECKTFSTSNNKIWHIKTRLDCNSTNVIYFLTCNMCDGEQSYIGKTNKLRLRTNNHISSCRHGNGPNIFDNHVYQCGMKNKNLCEPYFKLFAFMKVSSEDKLLTYERYLQRRRYDTMNWILATKEINFNQVDKDLFRVGEIAL